MAYITFQRHIKLTACLKGLSIVIMLCITIYSSLPIFNATIYRFTPRDKLTDPYLLYWERQKTVMTRRYRCFSLTMETKPLFSYSFSFNEDWPGYGDAIIEPIKLCRP